MLILGLSFLFPFFLSLFAFLLVLPSISLKFSFTSLPFLPPFCPLNEETIPSRRYCYRDSNLFSVINLRILALCPPSSFFSFFLVAMGDRLDVGSSGSEKPSVAPRIIISHYFITYLLVSMIELSLSGTVRKLLFIVRRELCSYLWFFFANNDEQAFESSSKLHSINI